jgi:acetyl esterase/lipase
MTTFNAAARQTLKPVFNSDYDPTAFRLARNAPVALEGDSTFRALTHGRLEFRPGCARKRLVAYVAGGGFCFDADDSHRWFLDEVSKALDADGCLIRYRLAPENPFPAAFDDVYEAIDHLLGDRAPADLALIADSAGAALVLSAVMARLSASRPPPGRLVFISALTDMAMTGRSHVFNAEADPLFGPQAIIHKAYHYLQGTNPTDPKASPYWGSPSGLPPCLFLVGSTEVMLDDSRRFATRASEAGVDARISIYPEAPHTFALMDAMPEAAVARAEVVGFLREVWPNSVDEAD